MHEDYGWLNKGFLKMIHGDMLFKHFKPDQSKQVLLCDVIIIIMK